MNDLQLLEPAQLWTKQEMVHEIKKIYAPNLTDGEFKTFVEIGKATALNPFLKEIWAVKFGNNAAQIFVGRDGYRTSIGRNPNYESHTVDAVYENDTFEIDAMNNKYSHKYNLCKRGKLIGAYCLVFMKNSSRPYYVFCAFEEYEQKSSSGKPTLWQTKPATMIKKVAEAQCIRMALPNMFNGTYSEAELPEERTRINTSQPNPELSTESVNSRIIDVDHEQDEKVNALIDEINQSWDEEELQSIGKKIANQNFTVTVKQKLGTAYRERLQYFKDQDQKLNKDEVNENTISDDNS